MRRSFEEFVGSELDRLYRAALFLVGGHSDQAEEVLTEAILDAHRQYSTRSEEPDRPDRWLDGHMVRTVLRMEGDPLGTGSRAAPFAAPEADEELPRATSPLPSLPPKIDLEDVARAATALPLRHRVAFWLAVVERRRYSDIGEVLDEPRDRVVKRIREGHRVIVSTLSRNAARMKDGSGRRHGM